MQRGYEWHNEWTQVLKPSAPSNSLAMTITYRFNNYKTLEGRFREAVKSGEPVTWTVTFAGNTETLTGTYWFSDGASLPTQIWTANATCDTACQDNARKTLWAANSFMHRFVKGNT